MEELFMKSYLPPDLYYSVEGQVLTAGYFPEILIKDHHAVKLSAMLQPRYGLPYSHQQSASSSQN